MIWKKLLEKVKVFIALIKKIVRIWLVSNEEIKNLQSSRKINSINFYPINNLKNKINFKLNSPYGLGWEINDNNEATMNGDNSSMIFQLQKELCNNNLEHLKHTHFNNFNILPIKCI